MTKFRTAFAVLLTAVVLLACSGDDDSATETTASTTSATATPSAAASTGDVVYSGDADTNPACDLLTVADAEAAAGSHVNEVNGTATGGSYADTSHNCFWIPAPGDPGLQVEVQVETPLGSAHDDAVQGLQDTIDIGAATSVDGLGDLAITGRGVAKAVTDDQLVAVLITSPNDDASSTDTGQVALDLLRAILQS